MTTTSNTNNKHEIRNKLRELLINDIKYWIFLYANF